MGSIEIIDSLFSNGATTKWPLKATVLFWISSCNPLPVATAIKIIVIPNATATFAILII